MFTGIVEAKAHVLMRADSSLTIERPADFSDCKTGASIAVDGVCLTISSLDEKSMTFDVLDTTSAKSTLGSLQKNDIVHLERALAASGRFDGHVMQGHSEGTGDVIAREEKGNDLLLSIRLPADLRRFAVLHGSIALHGVALTIAAIHGDVLTVVLIPETRKRTTLGDVKVGGRLNIETDLIGRYLLASHDR